MQKQDYRIEADELGETKVDKRFYWGSSTQRSLEYFKIGTEKMPIHSNLFSSKPRAHHHTNTILEVPSQVVVSAICGVVEGSFGEK